MFSAVGPVVANSVITFPGIDATAARSTGVSEGESSASGSADVIDRVTRASRDQEAAVIMASASRFLGVDFPSAMIVELLDEAYGSVADDYGLEEAIEWGKGFVIPQSSVDEGEGLMREHDGDFSKVVEVMKARLAGKRLSYETVRSLSAENPDLALVTDLVEGVRVFTRAEFVPNGTLPPLPPRNMYLKAKEAVHKLFHDLVDQGLALVMTSETARSIEGVHFIVAHWAPKKGKKYGRGITDASDDSYPESVLNGNEVRDQVNAFYGEIEHPTIVTAARMVLGALAELQTKRPGATLNDLDVFKCDLKGAFNLLWWRTEGAKLFGVELADGLTMVFLCGTFGYTGMPGAFQVVTRALKYEIRKRVAGKLEMYVDDVIAASPREAVSDDINSVGCVSRGLLGPDAIADDKTESTDRVQRRIDALGYTIDLADGVTNARVSISKRNRLKTAYGFFTVDVHNPVPFTTIEKLASWSARYGFICMYLKPFTGALFGAMKGRKRNASITLGKPAKRAIIFWRAILCAIALDERAFARPLASFLPRPEEFVIRFDASLSGVGILLGLPVVDELDPTRQLEPRWVGGVAVSLLDLGFGEDSSFQNTAEFIGATLSLFFLRGTGLRGRAVRLEGDSVSALTWTEKGSARGERAHNASVVFSLASIRWGSLMPFECFKFIPGAENTLRDDLSRGIAVKDLSVEGLIDFGPALLPTLLKARDFCDPGIDPTEDEAFFEFWGGLRVFLDGVRSGVPSDFEPSESGVQDVLQPPLRDVALNHASS